MTPSFIVEQIWITMLILTSFVGCGAIGNAIYMRWIYSPPQSTDSVQIEFLAAEKTALKEHVARVEKEHGELIKLVMDSLKQ